MTQPDLFSLPVVPPAVVDITRARKRRERVLDLIARGNALYLERVRGAAREAAHRLGTVTIDDVREAMLAHGIPMPHEVGCDTRVLGTVFRSREWEPQGQKLTRRQDRIARAGVGSSYITVYRLREGV